MVKKHADDTTLLKLLVGVIGAIVNYGELTNPPTSTLRIMHLSLLYCFVHPL